MTYCMRCRKEIEKCECKGLRNTISGDFIVAEKGFKCKCGNDSFRPAMHIDRDRSYITVYDCTECDNSVTTEAERG